MNPISVLSNGLELFKDDFWRGWAAVLGLTPLHHLSVVKTNNAAILDQINATGGFGFAVVRRPDKISFFQKQIDGVTRSPWPHCIKLIGDEIGREARRIKPDLMKQKQSHRWTNRSPGHPVPMIEGIRAVPSKFETVDSQLAVEVSDLRKFIDAGEQVIVFTNPDWTTTQKVAMAIEAYSWVGEPYDIFEIGNWISKWFPNTSKLKVCSSLVYKIIETGDIRIMNWAYRHGLNGEKFAPRDIFAYGSDHPNFLNFSFKCAYDDALTVKA